RSVAAPAVAHAALALRRTGELVPLGVREHHQIAAAHDERLAHAFAVQPRLATPYEMKDRAGHTRGIKRPFAGIAALLEDTPAKAKRGQNVRQQIRLRGFGYEIRRSSAFSSVHGGAIYALPVGRARPGPRQPRGTCHDSVHRSYRRIRTRGEPSAARRHRAEF